MANNPYTDPQRTAQKQAQQAAETAQRMSAASQKMAREMAQRANVNSQRFAKEASDRAARNFADQQARGRFDPRSGLSAAGTPDGHVEAKSKASGGSGFFKKLFGWLVVALIVYAAARILGWV